MEIKKRLMTELCPINTITQGSIFNYAVSEKYNAAHSLGMIISARCDVSNDKHASFSYLPVVKFAEFFLKEIFPKLIIEKIKNETVNVKNLIKNEGNDAAAVELFGLEQAIEKLIKKTVAKKKALESFETINKLKKILVKELSEISKSDLACINEKTIQQEIDKFISNRVEGFFIIDEVVDYNDSGEKLGPYVVLLREVHHISSDVVCALKKGVIHEQVMVIEGSSKSINIHNDAMSYVLCNIKSPYVELIMQRFACLFTRIGVRDPDERLSTSFFEANIKEVLK